VSRSVVGINGGMDQVVVGGGGISSSSIIIMYNYVVHRHGMSWPCLG
jgi:hypothetical protein